MTIRNRVYNSPLKTGTFKRVTSITRTSTSSTREEKLTCEDVVDGTKNPHRFVLNKRYQVGPYITQTVLGSGSGNLYWDNWIPDYFNSNGMGHLALNGDNLNTVNANSWATTWAARTNPNRPSVSLPVMVAELRDIPRTIRTLALGQFPDKRDKKYNVGRHYLAYSFGIEPLVKDIERLFKFSDSVDKRVNELDRLSSKGGLHRRINLRERTADGTVGTTTVSSITSILFHANAVVKTESKTWATGWWLPSGDLPRNTQKETLRKARLLVLGLLRNKTISVSDFSDAWELLPWSWMADWFGNIGEFLMANRNDVPCSPHNICIMENTKTVRTWTMLDAWCTGRTVTERLETKCREVGIPSLSAGLEFLSPSQMSILGALSIARGRR
jgi:hypothetical protein